MGEQEKKNRKDDQIKQKIRERYRGVSEDELDVIPAMPTEDFYRSEAPKRVAVYARVSTDDPNQTSSYELQKNHYEDMVKRRSNWDLVDIYADEGISGTSLQHRDSFIRMIEDCKAGKIDLIVTKSVSRFARNILDCIGYVRELKSYEPKVGVYFETENIYTLDENSEMALSFIATLAQEESHSKSEIMNASIEMRFKRGIFLTPVLLGYDHDENGNLVVNEDEALTVQYIYYSYLYGLSTEEIATELTSMERLTKKGNPYWSDSSVRDALSNERYCGDVLARKTFTPNFLNHKSKVNRHDRNQYRQKDHHEAIISREDFFAVQKMLRNAKYGNKGYYPEIHVIADGFLKGFVTVHPRWSGFREEDYYAASQSVLDGVVKIPSKPYRITCRPGDFDLRGYELVKTQFISTLGKISVTVSTSTIKFNKVCVGKMPTVHRIELLLFPDKHLIAVRKAPEGSRYGLEWSKQDLALARPKPIGGKAFLPTVFAIYGWEPKANYKITGTIHGTGEDAVIVFNVKDATMLLAPEKPPASEGEETKTATPATTVKATRRIETYPSGWTHRFGEAYYRVRAAAAREPQTKDYRGASADTSTFRLDHSNVTTPEEAAKKLKRLRKLMVKRYE